MQPTKNSSLWGPFLLASLLLVLAQVPFWSSAKEHAAGVQPIAYTMTEQAVIPEGYSAKNAIMTKDVYNEKNEKVGTVEDLIVSTDKQVTFAIVGAGGFLGLGTHPIAVPVRLLKLQDDGKILIQGATKAALLELPKFKYNKN